MKREFESDQGVDFLRLTLCLRLISQLLYPSVWLQIFTLEWCCSPVKGEFIYLIYFTVTWHIRLLKVLRQAHSFQTRNLFCNAFRGYHIQLQGLTRVELPPWPQKEIFSFLIQLLKFLAGGLFFASVFTQLFPPYLLTLRCHLNLMTTQVTQDHLVKAYCLSYSDLHFVQASGVRIMRVILGVATWSHLCRLSVPLPGFCCPLWILGKCCGCGFPSRVPLQIGEQQEIEVGWEKRLRGAEGKILGYLVHTKRWGPQGDS